MRVNEDLQRARGGDDTAFARLVDPHRSELRAHCYRMCGSVTDAEDLLQDTLVRAWKGLPGFEERASLRTWLYRVATTACLDALKHRQRRGLPMDHGPAATPDSIGPPQLDPIWISPCPDAWVPDAAPDSRYDARQSVALAFLAAIQYLPPRQRATLLLFDVLGFSATECAELLETSPAAINSALQRARQTLESRAGVVPPAANDAPTRELLQRYIDAWEGCSVEGMVALLRDDAVLAMPPLPQWLRGREDIAASLAAMVLRPEARGRFRLRATSANRRPAVVAYERGEDGVFRPRALHLLYADGDRIAAMVAFMDPTVLATFDIPAELPVSP